MFQLVSVSRWRLRSVPAPPSVCPGSCKKEYSTNGMSSQHLPGPASSLQRVNDQESPKMQRGGKDPLKVWSIRNKKTKMHLREKPARNAHTSLSVHISEHDGIQCPLPNPPLWMHATVCFSRRQDGFSDHCRLAKQDLFAQTLRIRIIGAAFPLVQSSPSHSAGQNSQNGLITPAGQPLNVQT